YSQCQFIDLFKDKKKPSATHNETGGITPPLIGDSIGTKAGGLDAAALAAVHDVTSAYPPAAIRPDPDTFIRLMLNQYRAPSATTARQVALVEAYRPLLGGASTDFLKPPSLGYDATSLLSHIKVAEIICEGLINPNGTTHEGWQ